MSCQTLCPFALSTASVTLPLLVVADEHLYLRGCANQPLNKGGHSQRTDQFAVELDVPLSLGQWVVETTSQKT